MSRIEKLFQRLDELEATYRALAAEEFAKWVHGRWYGFFLVKKLPFLYSTRYAGTSVRERLDETLRVEKEIETLRIKLDQPMSQSPVQIVRDAAAQICAAHQSGVGTEVMIAKALLKDLGHDHSAEQTPR